MKCVICHGTVIKLKEVHEEITFENDVIYVPIQTPVCETCGERYYDRTTMKMLENVERLVSTKQAHLKEIGKVLMYS